MCRLSRPLSGLRPPQPAPNPASLSTSSHRRASALHGWVVPRAHMALAAPGLQGPHEDGHRAALFAAAYCGAGLLVYDD